MRSSDREARRSSSSRADSDRVRGAVRAGGVFGVGHTNGSAESLGLGPNPVVIGGDDETVEGFGPRRSFEYVLNDGLAGKRDKCFAGKSRGSKTGRNDTENPMQHDRSYHKLGP